MPASCRGKFIVIEGMDGAGTTTQMSRLARYLFEQEKCNTVLLTREPTDISDYGKELHRRLRHQLLPGEEVIDDPQFWADLFVNDRKWHLDNFVVPAVTRGHHVISDRYKLSTLAYQSVQGPNIIDHPLDMDHLVAMHQGLYIPDLTLLLDVSADEAFRRIDLRTAITSAVNKEYFERVDFLRQVQKNYHLAVSKCPNENIVVIDGSKPIDDVEKLIQEEVSKLFGYNSVLPSSL